MGRLSPTYYDNLLLSKCKQLLGYAMASQPGYSSTFEQFCEGLDTEDASSKKAFEVLLRETTVRRARPTAVRPPGVPGPRVRRRPRSGSEPHWTGNGFNPTVPAGGEGDEHWRNHFRPTVLPDPRSPRSAGSTPSEMSPRPWSRNRAGHAPSVADVWQLLRPDLPFPSATVTVPDLVAALNSTAPPLTASTIDYYSSSLVIPEGTSFSWAMNQRRHPDDTVELQLREGPLTSSTMQDLIGELFDRNSSLDFIALLGDHTSDHEESDGARRATFRENLRQSFNPPPENDEFVQRLGIADEINAVFEGSDSEDDSMLDEMIMDAQNDFLAHSARHRAIRRERQSFNDNMIRGLLDRQMGRTEELISLRTRLETEEREANVAALHRAASSSENTSASASTSGTEPGRQPSGANTPISIFTPATALDDPIDPRSPLCPASPSLSLQHSPPSPARSLPAPLAPETSASIAEAAVLARRPIRHLPSHSSSRPSSAPARSAAQQATPPSPDPLRIPLPVSASFLSHNDHNNNNNNNNDEVQGTLRRRSPSFEALRRVMEESRQRRAERRERSRAAREGAQSLAHGLERASSPWGRDWLGEGGERYTL